MSEPYQSNAWKLISKEAGNVDVFLTPSQYYKEFFITRTGLSEGNFKVIPLGLDPGELINVQKRGNWPAVGYFCRINSHNGFDKLVDAFLEIKSGNELPGLTLHISGGYTGDDKPFISEQIRKIKMAGLKSFIRIYPEFHGNSKQDFFSNIDVMSVPVRKYDGYGLYILEANAAGVPVVQPATGAFQEIIARTGGGITYSPDNINELSACLIKVLKDKELLLKLGTGGKENVLKQLSLEGMSEELSKVYNGIM
jgi:glycosyltransferase involved in cell wall biosynthesis